MASMEAAMQTTQQMQLKKSRYFPGLLVKITFRVRTTITIKVAGTTDPSTPEFNCFNKASVSCEQK